MAEDLPVPFKILGKYDKQKFIQFNPEDTANWYLATSENGKNQVAMYPLPGRRHINLLGNNKLIFSNEPRGLFKSINYSYIVDGSKIYRIDAFLNQTEIDGGLVTTNATNVFFDYLVSYNATNNAIIFSAFVDGQNLYIYREDTGSFTVVTDTSIAGIKPSFVAAFGNRLVVAGENSGQFFVSVANLGGGSFDPATCFGGGTATFASVNGFIRQLIVFKNILYVFTDYNTYPWANFPSTFSGTNVSFPYTLSKSYLWDYGILDALSISVGFNMMVWLGQNEDGLVQVLMTKGDNPVPISTKAIDLLFQPNDYENVLSPFVESNANGFLYQLDNTVLYRLSAGVAAYQGILDYQQQANSIEYNFDTQTWERAIEADGSRNKIDKHVYFSNMHLVTVQGETTVYQMSDQFYINELRNPNQSNPQAADAYNQFAVRYERVTPIIREEDDGEFITDWVQIDFVWGLYDFINSTVPFQNAQFIIAENADSSGDPIYMVSESNPDQYLITENSNFATAADFTYNTFFKPHIELYFSDDGGISYKPSDVLEFSQLGIYLWRMRWYQLGASRLRTYKLVCVSPSPVVVLGGLMLKRRASGGAS